jgi:signal transduction histidine kinase
LPLLPPQVEEAAFRIVAESLTNVARHSAARKCAVRLTQANGDLRVQVFDNGQGLSPESGSGHGLDSMRRRAADVGGSLRVEAASPQGTLVTAVLPLGSS